MSIPEDNIPDRLALTFLPRVEAYLKKKPCATYKDIADSLIIGPALVKKCFEIGELKYKGNLKPPKLDSAAMARRSKTAKLILRHMGPSGSNKVIVMDKVSSICADVNSNYFCNHIYLSKDQPSPSKTFWDVLEQTKDPRPDFYLVWQAMTSDGSVSPIVIMINKLDTKQCVDECLRKVLVPWLNKRYKLEDVLFWPDLCPRHNSTHVTKFLDANKISYVKKSDNSPKMVHARPIEFCMDKCKEDYRRLAHRKKEAKDLEDFRKIYTKINKEVMKEHAKELCAEIPENLLAIKKRQI